MKLYIKCVAAMITLGALTSIAEEVSDVTEDIGATSNNNSIRIRLSSAPGIDAIEDSVGSFDIDDEGGSRIDVMYARRFSGIWGNSDSNFGGVIAGGVFIGSHSGSLVGVEVTELTTFGGIFEGGVAFKAGEAVVLEITPYIGFGVAENETIGFESGTGPIVIYGINGSVFILLSDNIELGLQAGYGGFSQEQDFDVGAGVVETATFSGSGATIGGVLAIKF